MTDSIRLARPLPGRAGVVPSPPRASVATSSACVDGAVGSVQRRDDAERRVELDRRSDQDLLCSSSR